MNEQLASEQYHVRRIYNMRLNEVYATGQLIIRRVPGGWLYQHEEGKSFAFVPLNDEFVPKFCEVKP